MQLGSAAPGSDIPKGAGVYLNLHAQAAEGLLQAFKVLQVQCGRRAVVLGFRAWACQVVSTRQATALTWDLRPINCNSGACFRLTTSWAPRGALLHMAPAKSANGTGLVSGRRSMVYRSQIRGCFAPLSTGRV